MDITLLQPAGYGTSSCGYCKTNGRRHNTSRSYGMVSPKMTPQFYMDLVNRGWRRSGDYFYHPDMARTCCPQYTIRLDVGSFKPARQQRSTINRWNTFLGVGERSGAEGGVEGKAKGKGKGKAKAKGAPFDLMTELRRYRTTKGTHTFELELTPAKATDETFALYERYQVAVHHDKPGSVRRSGFSRFLCDSPLSEATPIKYKAKKEDRPPHLPTHYGSHHLLYRVDGVLVGISVIDILPGCVSSVYFIWEPEWAWASLGKLSALYEIALVLEMAEAGAEMGWLYMGYWIANCQKMRYKGEYGPSFLLDPGTQVFHPLTGCLDEYLQSHGGYTPFVEVEGMDSKVVREGYEAWKKTSGGRKEGGCMEVEGGTENTGGGGEEKEKAKEKNDHDMDEDENGEDEDSDDSDDDAEEVGTFPTPPPPGFTDPAKIKPAVLNQIGVAAVVDASGRPAILPYAMFQKMLTPVGRRMTKELVAAVGVDMMGTLRDHTNKGFLSFD